MQERAQTEHELGQNVDCLAQKEEGVEVDMELSHDLQEVESHLDQQ